MPTRYGNLFDKCFTMEALFSAYQTARRGKRKTMAVHRFEQNLGANLAMLCRELDAGTYRPSPYRQFMIYEPKPRMISAPAFRDVVVQHAIYAAINPIFDKGFLPDSYGCRVGGGIHKASDRAQMYLRQSPPESFTLQMDIRRFYYRIDRTILRRLIERKIKDRRLVDLMMLFAKDAEPLGLPIGNLLSQLYALIYLNPLDHFVKREMKIAAYVRYVDDFILFGLSRDAASAARRRIESWLDEHLGLELSHWTIQPVRRGVNFVGFRTWRKVRFVRKRSLYNFRRAMLAGNIRALVSLIGHARHTATFTHYQRQISRRRKDGYDLPLPASCNYRSKRKQHCASQHRG